MTTKQAIESIAKTTFFFYWVNWVYCLVFFTFCFPCNISFISGSFIFHFLTFWSNCYSIPETCPVLILDDVEAQSHNKGDVTSGTYPPQINFSIVPPNRTNDLERRAN